jgi:uncharacterized SAM-binding protein YcdF (DUF218 family)
MLCPRPALWWTAGILALALLIWWSYAALLNWIAGLLIVDDALRPASAIVVLGGGPSFRALEAAELYRTGWAPRIIATGAVNWDRDVLLGAGVPPSAIVLTDGTPRDTLEELQTVSRLVSAHGGPVILVTSKVHTRRTRLIWRHVTGQAIGGIVRSARRDPFDPSHWWCKRRSTDDVFHEYLSLVNYYLGFPIPPRHAMNSGQPQLLSHA